MIRSVWIPLLALTLVAACSSTYEARPLGFKPPSASPGFVRVGALEAAAQSYDKADAAEEDFGFDILGATVLPVKVVFENRGDAPYQINADQTFLEDANGELWQLLDKRTTFDRVEGYTQEEEIVSEGVRSGILGGVAGALIGAAIGVIGGGDVGTAVAIGKGAAVGSIAGGLFGGAQGATSDEPMRQIRRDLARKALQNKPIAPQALSVGALYFPGEAAAPTRLRMQVRNQSTGELHMIVFPLRPGIGAGSVQPVTAPPAPARDTDAGQAGATDPSDPAVRPGAAAAAETARPVTPAWEDRAPARKGTVTTVTAG